MPELIEQMYCSQQIVIPPKFPYILKRYCKAAIKTQPYDLLRWSFEYFKALAANKPPPVKLRLEYPIYSTEGGLTRGCLKVLAHQLSSMVELPLPVVKSAWQGFCLDPVELRRILCLCEVYMKEESVPFLHFIAVAGGFLTKCLTHTMILLCESLTKEPDGGSAAISKDDFLVMYKLLAEMDASRDVKYFNGYREGIPQEIEEEEVETEQTTPSAHENGQDLFHVLSGEDDYWEDQELQRVSLIDDHVARTPRLSIKKKLRELSQVRMAASAMNVETQSEGTTAVAEGKKVSIMEVDSKPKIFVFDEEDQPVPLDGFGYDEENSIVESSMMESSVREMKQSDIEEESGMDERSKPEVTPEEDAVKKQMSKSSHKSEKSLKEEEGDETRLEDDKMNVNKYLENIQMERENRIADVEKTFDEIAEIVDKFNSINYDLGMVAGRQMSTTSGEFIAKHIEKHIMAFVDEQIAVLPDPDLKKKKAKPEELLMIREILEQFLDENMDIIVPDVEEVEEEEQPVPEITVVYAVPGIGGPVDADTIKTFEEYIHEVCQVQSELVMPRNLRHFLCPPLEKYIEHNYESDEERKKEEVPINGTITD